MRLNVIAKVTSVIATITARLEAKDYIALASMIIATCSLALTMYTGFATIRHNRLGAMPRVGFLLPDVKGQALTLSLTNRGFGPAIVRTKVYVNGIFCPSWAHVLDAVGMASKENTVTNSLFSNILRPGDAQEMIRIPSPRPNAAKQLLDTLELHVCSCSFYNDCRYERYYSEPPERKLHFVSEYCDEVNWKPDMLTH
jgi:hypothetical protein